MTDSSTNRTTFTATKGAIGCAIGLALAIASFAALVAGAYLAVGDRGADSAEATGRIVGLMLLPLGGGSLAAGLAWMYRRWLGALLTLGLALAVAGLIGLMFMAAAHLPTVFRDATDAERATPTLETIDGEPVLVQRALGFALPVPPGLTYVPDDAQLRDMLASQPESASHMVAWRWSCPAQVPQVIVVVDLESQRSPEAEAEFVGGVVEGASESLAPQGFEPPVHETRGPLDHVLRTHVAGSDRGMTMRILGYEHADALVVLTVTVAGTDLAGMTSIAEGVHPL